MPPAVRDRSLGVGVYYAPGDYVGLWRRVAILIVDLFVLFVGLVILGIACLLIFPPLFILLASAWIWSYETLLKRSGFRTFGYRLLGCKIVNLQGQPPSLFALTLCLLMWLGPFHFLFDLIWSGIDDDRQTLRDRYARTCVVKVNAEPIGSGDIQLVHYFAGGFALMYPRVMPLTGKNRPIAA